ncbi:hypothetical protein Scep_013107 [Stephania cephalantha]|uniref:Uncharacterized protein n=1 Tax=Stephania cephalantha TaxID=152367 RepID=A0AAP0JGQ2_9MAGN
MEACSTCLNFAEKDIVRCPNGKRAFVRFENCILRYSDVPFFSRVETSPIRLLGNGNNASNADVLNKQVDGLMNRLTTNAASNPSLFGRGIANYTNSDSVYGMVQCTRDLSETDCLSCLQQMIRGLNSCCRGQNGARVTCASCTIRYEVYSFFDLLSLTPPPPNTLQSPWPSSQTNSTQGNGDKSSRNIAVIVAPIVAGVLLLLVALCVVACSVLRKKRTKRKNISGIVVDDLRHSTESLEFDFATIRSATDNFSDENKLGQGGFGSVYKGELSNGQQIAVKRLSNYSSQGSEEFKNEVMLLHKLQHKNLVRLLGFCLEEKEQLLVYEYVPYGSLDKYIFDPTKRSYLDWESRYRIIRGIARGMLYLHEDSRLRIIHRDLKASNILLDNEINPKISDFGMARLFQMDQTHDKTRRVAGTFGYMAPEYVIRGIYSVKSDVYSFGVLLLEIICGEKNINVNQSSTSRDLLNKAWEHWREGTALEFIDSSLRTASSSEAMKCIHIALLCIQKSIEDRPTMASIVLMLDSTSPTLATPSPPPFLLESESLLTAEP